MKTTRVEIYDPPMCCPSGVCGLEVNPGLARFSSDLDWLRQQGIEVERYSLSSNPAAFAQQQAVREALKNDGNECLPLIVVNDSIVSKGTYPVRSDLIKFVGLEGNETASSAQAGSDKAACGPGCCCGTPSGSKKMKIVVSLAVLVAIAGIFIYKAAAAKSNGSYNTTPACGTGFAVAPNAAAGTSQPSTAPEQSPGEAQAGQKIGDYLESLSALNKVAMNQDAVFIFIPNAKGELAADKTNAAVLAAQQTLKRSNITLGLYTLRASSPDYAGISSKVQAPAILIASKGKGMAAVSGDVTETKLLQAFVASSSAGGGCGPSGCGSSSGGCN
ncbi:MAG: arsenite efflux transporter metallochaperone ArsD [Phycisphaerae bacterium]|jgi:hypothetical protein